MLPRKLRSAAVAAMLGCALAACSAGDATAPAPMAPSAGSDALLGDVLNPLVSGVSQVLSTPQIAVGVEWLRPLAAPVAASAVIGPNGGTIEVKATGIKVVFPTKALRLSTRITVTALAGKAVAYDFQPHGIRFAAPVRLEQDLARVRLDERNLGNYEAAYFADPSLLDALRGLALVTEILPLQLDFSSKRASFDVWHFSGYMVSSGRKK